MFSRPTYRETILPSPDEADAYAQLAAMLASPDVRLFAGELEADIPAEVRAALVTFARLLAANRAVRVTITDEEEAERAQRSMDAFTRLGEEQGGYAPAEARHDAAS